ncbi:iron chelate uptake ABC transporter family permease subunit [Paenibacillus sp. FSL K6-3182]|uniref:iron chelate uptake ABC transporter family permease subunit n=1 Tax=Paenibacillus sp. FSL K6-3182 TaxID=2921495 RepID=UPI0030D52DC7
MITHFPCFVTEASFFLASCSAMIICRMMVYLIAWKKGVNSFSLVLVGIGVAFLLSAMTTFMLVFIPAYSSGFSYIWVTGTVCGTSWTYVWNLLPWTFVIMVIALDLSIYYIGHEITGSNG